MDDIEEAAMRVLEIPFVIAIGFVIEVVMSGLNPESGGMDRLSYRPGSQFVIPVWRSACPVGGSELTNQELQKFSERLGL